MTDGIAEHVGPTSSIDGIGFADVMQQLTRNRQALPYAASQRIPAIPEIHPDKPPLEPPAVRDVFGVRRLDNRAAEFEIVIVVEIKIGLKPSEISQPLNRSAVDVGDTLTGVGAELIADGA